MLRLQRLRILVLGATGHLGHAVLRRALDRGHRVTAATRRASPPALRGLDIDIAPIDGELRTLAEIAAGHDLVVDAAAPYPLSPCFPGSAAWRAAVEGAVRRTERVIEAALARESRLVFISSFTTIPCHEPPMRAMETAWRRSVYPYFEAKAAMEETVAAAAARRGLPAVIVNPVVCLGPWEYRADAPGFVRTVLDYGAPFAVDRCVNVIDVRDVAVAIELALEREFFGRPILLAGHYIGAAELAARIAALSGSRATPFPVDSRFASMVGFWAGAAAATWGVPASEIWGAIPLAAETYPSRPSPEQIALGLRIRPLDETLRDAIAFHVNRD